MSLPKWLYNEYVHEIGHGLSNRTRSITVQIAKALLILTVFSSCATRPPDPMATSSDTVKATNRHESNVTTADTALENDADYLDCIRGPAEPIVKQSVYPNAIFSLNPDNHHGTETVDLSNGDRLVIRNHGCEYYVLTFRF